MQQRNELMSRKRALGEKGRSDLILRKRLVILSKIRRKSCGGVLSLVTLEAEPCDFATKRLHRRCCSVKFFSTFTLKNICEQLLPGEEYTVNGEDMSLKFDNNGSVF